MLEKQIEMAERRRVMANDLRVREQSGSTYLAHTHEDLGGRYAAISSPVVVGSKPIPEYPAAYSQHDPVPDEPALGLDISAVEPCGTQAEIEASIAALNPSPEPPAFPEVSVTPPARAQVPPLADRAGGLSSPKSYRRY